MEFTFDDDLREVAALAADIFEGSGDTSHVRTVEAEGGFDTGLWKRLADADLIGLCLPEDVGGSGLDLTALVAVLEEQGRRVVPVPLWAVVTQGALPLATHGTQQQRERWVPPVVRGDTLVTGSFELSPDGSPLLRGTDVAEGWRVSGSTAPVVAGDRAAAVLVPVQTSAGVRVAVLPTDREGIVVTPVPATDRNGAAVLELSGVLVGEEDLLRGDGASLVRGVRARGQVALGALCAGVGAGAVEITAAYTSQRHQFGRALSTNQAVALRAADAHLDTERVRLTTYRAAWHLSRGEEEQAVHAALVAKWWVATGGLRAVHATQHLHGGIGADVDYPIHRYFLWGRQLAFTLGSAGAVEAELGTLLPATAPIGAPA